jgi:hypothetical protein
MTILGRNDNFRVKKRLEHLRQKLQTPSSTSRSHAQFTLVGWDFYPTYTRLGAQTKVWTPTNFEVQILTPEDNYPQQ